MVLCTVEQGDAGLFNRLQDGGKPACSDGPPAGCCRCVLVRPPIAAGRTFQRTRCDSKPAACGAAAPARRCSLRRCDASCCELTLLIDEAHTGCYPRQRRRAVHRLGDRYSSAAHPEVLGALVSSLNDADPRVRRKASDEIGDQLRRHAGCRRHDVVCALAETLADPDARTRHKAERALQFCGYDVVDPADHGFAGVRQTRSVSAQANAASRPHTIQSASFQQADPGSRARPPVMMFQTKREFLESKACPNKGRSGLAGLFGLAQ